MKLCSQRPNDALPRVHSPATSPAEARTPSARRSSRPPASAAERSPDVFRALTTREQASVTRRADASGVQCGAPCPRSGSIPSLPMTTTAALRRCSAIRAVPSPSSRPSADPRSLRWSRATCCPSLACGPASTRHGSNAKSFSGFGGPPCSPAATASLAFPSPVPCWGHSVLGGHRPTPHLSESPRHLTPACEGSGPCVRLNHITAGIARRVPLSRNTADPYRWMFTPRLLHVLVNSTRRATPPWCARAAHVGIPDTPASPGAGSARARA